MIDSPEASLGFLDGAREPLLHRIRLAGFKDTVWPVRDSGIGSYLANVCFDRRRRSVGDVANFVFQSLQKTDDNIGVDIAGGQNGTAISQLIMTGLLTKGLVTNYSDLRSMKDDAYPKLDHIAGNLTKPKTWRKIIDWQDENAPEGFALVLHRPLAGLQELPPATYADAADLVLDMMRPGGIMFCQVPDVLRRATNSHYLEATHAGIRSRPDVHCARTASDFILNRRYLVVVKVPTPHQSAEVLAA